MDFSQVRGLRGTGSSGTLAGLCTAPEHVALLGWAQHPWLERGPWVSSTGSRYCTEQNEVHHCGGVKQGRMVIGLRFFHTLGTVGLFQDCEQGGGRILGPGEDFVSSAAQCCPSLLQKGAVTTAAHLWGEPWGCPASHPHGCRGSRPGAPWGWLQMERSARPGAAGPQLEVPASSAQSPCLQHSLPPGPAPPVLEEAHNGV